MKAKRVRFFAPYIAIGSFALLLLHSASSASLHWSVPSAKDWFDLGNWDLSLLPTAADTTFIDNGGQAIVDTAGLTANAGSLFIGSPSGSGALEIGANGVLSDANAYVGDRSVGTVDVSGTWNNSAGVFIGGYFYGGTGTVNLLTGGAINSVYTRLGLNGTGSATIASGSTWNNHTGVFDVGFGGKGTVTLNGGTIYSGQISIGYDNSSVTINSGLWDANTTGQGFVLVGTSAGGTGTLTLNGGQLKAFASVLGNGGTGTAIVTGGTWTNSYQFFVGGYYYTGYYYNGVGNLTMSGGTISSYDSYVAYGGSGSSGTVTITGGAWNNTNSIAIGVTGTGSLVLSGTGTVAITGTSSTKTMTLGSQAGSQGTLQIGNNDAFTGTLNVLIVTGGAGTASVVFKQTNSYNAAVTFTGSLKIEQAGSGTTTLTKANTYSGGTTVKAGKLLVNAAGGTGSGAVVVKNGGAIGGTGSIGSSLTIESGGILAPESSTLAVNGGISLLDNAQLVFRLGTTGDQISSTAGLNLGQNISFTLTPIAGFGIGQYTLISFTGALTDQSNAFSGWMVQGLPANYTAEFVATGSALKVNVTTVPEPVSGVAFASGLALCLAIHRRRRRR